MTKQLKQYTHAYPSDLTDEQWATLEPLLQLDPDEPARKYNVRDMVDGIFYLNRTGCQWRYLPSDLPPWRLVQYYFYKWRNNGLYQQINTILARLVRAEEGRDPEPSAGSIDAQSVKTTEKRGRSTAMMPVSMSKDVSETYSLIHSV